MIISSVRCNAWLMPRLDLRGATNGKVHAVTKLCDGSVECCILIARLTGCAPSGRDDKRHGPLMDSAAANVSDNRGTGLATRLLSVVDCR